MALIRPTMLNATVDHLDTHVSSAFPGLYDKMAK